MAPIDKDKEGSDKYVRTKPVPKKEENQDSNKATKNKDSVHPCCLFFEYHHDTVIHDLPEGTSYTVRDLVEGYVDESGHPTGKKRK